MKNDLVKMHMPGDDAHVMDKIPQVKDKVNACIDELISIQYFAGKGIASLEELKEELNKL
jgi:hypothetical protein